MTMKQGRKEKLPKTINLDLNGTRGKGKTAQNDQSGSQWSKVERNNCPKRSIWISMEQGGEEKQHKIIQLYYKGAQIGHQTTKNQLKVYS